MLGNECADILSHQHAFSLSVHEMVFNRGSLGFTHQVHLNIGVVLDAPINTASFNVNSHLQ